MRSTVTALDVTRRFVRSQRFIQHQLSIYVLHFLHVLRIFVQNICFLRIHYFNYCESYCLYDNMTECLYLIDHNVNAKYICTNIIMKRSEMYHVNAGHHKNNKEQLLFLSMSVFVFKVSSCCCNFKAHNTILITLLLLPFHIDVSFTHYTF